MNEKSTIVRIIRLIARSTSALAPPLATRLLQILFTTPLSRSLRPRERKWMKEAQRSTVTIEDGRELALYSWGEGPPVLLVHGWSGRGAQLAVYAAPLVERGFRAVAVDGPAHGESDGRRTTPPDMADAVLATGRHLGELAGVVAHSLGTAATTIAISRGLEAQRLVYLAPPEELSMYLKQAGAFLGFSPEIAPRTQQRLERRYGLPFEDARGAVLAPTMTAPLLVIHDQGDEEVPYSEGARLVGHWPGAEMLTTGGLGHHRLVRDAKVVAAAVEFLAQRQEGVEAVSGKGLLEVAS